MKKTKEIPLFAEWHIKFIQDMNYFIKELPEVIKDDSHPFPMTKKDVEEFWGKWKYTVYEAFRDAEYWRDFKETIKIIVEEEQS